MMSSYCFSFCGPVAGGGVPPPVSPVSFMPKIGARLELAVYAAQQGGDRRAHGLVANENHDRDCRENQRILSHRLSAREPICLHVHLPDQIHFRVPPSVCVFRPTITRESNYSRALRLLY